MKFNFKTLSILCAALLCFSTSAFAEHFSGSRVTASQLKTLFNSEYPNIPTALSSNNNELLFSLSQDDGYALTIHVCPDNSEPSLTYCTPIIISSDDNFNQSVIKAIKNEAGDYLDSYDFFYSPDSNTFWFGIVYNTSEGFDSDDFLSSIEDFCGMAGEIYEAIAAYYEQMQ